MEDILQFGIEPSGAYNDRPSAYAVIFNNRGQLLVLKVGDGYHLPGGGIDSGEDSVTAVVRETREEAGCDVKDLQYIGRANQFFPVTEIGPINKTATFYRARIDALNAAQLREADHIVRWVTPKEFFSSSAREFQKWAVKKVISEAVWDNDSLRRNLSSFPVFGDFIGWLSRQIPRGWAAFYWEYPALLGQIFWFGFFISFNGVLMASGIDTAARAPGVLFFAFDILNFDFTHEPYLLFFIAMAFLFAWIVNKLILIVSPRLRNSSNGTLFFLAFVSFLVSLFVFSLAFSAMVSFLLR